MRNITLLLLFSCVFVSAQSNHPLAAKDYEAQQKWVDSVYNSLSIKEKIGQLFMPMVFSSQTKKEHQEIIRQIKEHKIGGVIFSKGGPIRQAKLTNEYQAISKTPLLVGIDAEWGLGMRLDSTVSFPWNMTLGAVKDNKLVKQTGYNIGEHCKRLGIHFNFAPVVDINTNPKNPIIGNRSFGEDRDNVTEKALAFMEGMQAAGVLATAKHFPGHGDTETDSHKTLPTISFNEQRIDSVELHPYKELIKNNLASVMVAHLNIPSLESRDGFPSTLSENIVTNILKRKLGFKGLIFTDALNMKGASNFSESEDVDLAAFKAGNDMLLISGNIGKGIDKLAEAYSAGEITEERLAHSVKKILMAKYKVGLNNYKPIGIANLVEDLNRLKDDLLNESLTEASLTVVKNKGSLMPLRKLENKSIAYVKLGDDDGSEFLKELKKYTKVHEISAPNLDDLISKLNNYNTVIVGFHKSNKSPWESHKFKNQELVWLYEIARTNTTILSVFTKPYALLDVKTHENIESILVSYQNSNVAQQKAAQLIFGAIPAKGELPVTSGETFKAGDGIKFTSLSRLGYALPESVGLNSKRLARIDSLAQYAVDSVMTPGLQLLVARKGKIVYNKNFGKHTYKGAQKVRWTDIYDIASLTKIVATLPLIMELEEKGIISLDSKLSDILPEFKGTNKEHVTIKKMLSHYAQLKPWIPFYTATLDSVTKKPDAKYYRRKLTKGFDVEVANKLFLRSDYQDSIQGIIKESDMLSRLRYRYSDLPYYILKKFIEKHYDQSLDELVQQHFYKSLGANYTTYKPRERFSKTQIVPSEIDDYFRYQEVHGYVHDMGAAMQNGVGGHAGVFSNANDIAKIMQMYLQKGFYGGHRYFRSETLDKFNECYYCESDNRRGVGFDKPQLDEDGPTCGCVSMTSFGHSGFTGTYAWADPEEELVYVFMANRTYPTSMNGNKLLKENIRTEIQRLIYEAIEE
ncbi:glycoside hydrolase family 3 N-terminal domain-containing protein [Pontimicrobium aquaticum]|uniref:beta-N-acetylhexosaminidase n=1 Tax=Pontimicrobium aquaticum TaxID=2565367 RepID=A0A4U0EKH9_9FLAO|nr:glycoside hydrolase family 3 N-terminal domain-containing protein [Pontimicrobium aquaticum]TJY31858.1 beta-N-acetylglucosaminidase [Pontimicrobium aquaticum]